MKDEYRRMVRQLLADAKAHRRIREDTTLTDIDLVLWAMRGAVQTTRGIIDNGCRRILAIMIAGLRPSTEEFRQSPMSEQLITFVSSSGPSSAAQQVRRA